jgi:hypothetical protein
MLFVFFAMWWRMVQAMELNNGAKLQHALGIPSKGPWLFCFCCLV